MLNKSRGIFALQLAGSLALSTFTMASHADPISLQAVCHVTSALPGQGRCQLSMFLSDSFTGAPADVRRSQIRVDNVLVAQYVNDIANPAQFSASSVSGSMEVACGVSHSVSARIARQGAVGYENVGALPPIVCPAAP